MQQTPADMQNAPLWDIMSADQQHLLLQPTQEPLQIDWDIDLTESRGGHDTESPENGSVKSNTASGGVTSSSEQKSTSQTRPPVHIYTNPFGIVESQDPLDEIDKADVQGVVEHLDDDLLDPDAQCKQCNTDAIENMFTYKARINLATHCAVGHRSRESIMCSLFVLCFWGFPFFSI